MNAVIHGIKNCSTMKKAFAWLDAAAVPYAFHDYRRDGIDAAALARWCDRLGWEALVNRRGTTWRKLTPEQQDIGSATQAIALMQAQPSLIRRPLVETAAGELIVGFDPERYAATFTEARQ